MERLMFYAGKTFAPTQELKEHVLFMKGSYEIERLLDVRESEDFGKQVLVQWMGFEVHEAKWKPYDVIASDVPELVEQFERQ